jgi:hypothetical protein
VRASALFAFMLWFGIVVAPAAAQVPDPTGGVRYGAVPAPDPAVAPADGGGVKPGQPGTAPTPGSPTPVVPGTKAVLLPDGSAAAPADAPPQAQKAVWAANSLQDKPYRYGGGHASFVDSGYDCSGTISFAFKAAGVLKTPLDSSSFMGWGDGGPGQWLTAYAHSGHAYAVIAGLRLDTSAGYTRSSRRARGSSKAAERGPRWRPSRRPSAGFTVRHPAGL